MNINQGNLIACSKGKSHPPALHSMVGWGSSDLAGSCCWSWFWSFCLPGVLWMGPARLHLSAVESCVSGSPTVFWLVCWVFLPVIIWVFSFLKDYIES